jgi:hypothetical protein
VAVQEKVPKKSTPYCSFSSFYPFFYPTFNQ